ncbi:MAG: hypothetical protein IH969_03235, partial [Candidatus Krumholzibacteriota bacterium]|nr:hypothetical protein [Candidatus Krumholzibacteriota bacterium]
MKATGIVTRLLSLGVLLLLLALPMQLKVGGEFVVLAAHNAEQAPPAWPSLGYRYGCRSRRSRSLGIGGVVAGPGVITVVLWGFFGRAVFGF